jgi:ABC-type nitrate/sulfonate/bicarbonate transport system substrate-binding protein
MKRPRALYLLSVATTLALLVTACQEDAPDAADDPDVDEAEAEEDFPTIRVAALASQNAAPQFFAIAKFAEDYGLEIEYDILASGGETVAGVTTGEYQFGTAGAGALLFNAVAEGLPLCVVAPMGMAYAEDYFVISSEFAATQEEAEELAADLTPLANETFGVNAPGVVLEAMLADMLMRGGLDYREVNIDYLPFPDQIPALATGALAATSVVDPFATQAEEQGAGFRPYERPDTPPEPAAVMHANCDWVEENRAAAEAFMAAYVDGARQLDEEGWYHDESLELIEEFTGQDPDVISIGRPPVQPPDLPVDFDQWRGYQEFFMEIGALDYEEPIDVEELWDLSLRDAVVD